MFLADTLSRAHLTEVHACSFAQELEEVDHTVVLAMPAAQLQRIKDIVTNDPVMTNLRDTIQRGWPASREFWKVYIRIMTSEMSLLSKKISFLKDLN